MTGTVLIIDDDADATLSLIRALKTSLPLVHFHAAAHPEKAVDLFATYRPHAVVLDLHLDRTRGVESGFALQQSFQSIDSSSRTVVLTGHSSIEHGVRALSGGASSFLEKPADISHLSALLRDAISQSEIRRAHQALAKEHRAEISSVICGASQLMQNVREAIAYAGQTSQPVFILGETGTGKGLCARAIHSLGRRRNGKLVRYQSTYSSADLVNSELFGHVKGAFTGALIERRGLLAEADGGTLFLDEVEALPVETQVSLLGVLQDFCFRAVGSNADLIADFRLICASNEDPVTTLEKGRLRKDFYHRISHFVLTLPALRDHREDIPELATTILNRLHSREHTNVMELETAALTALTEYDWPGNVRELEAAVEGGAYRAKFADRRSISLDDLTFSGTPLHSDLTCFYEKIEMYKHMLVQRALRANQGNQVHAARALGIDRSVLRRIVAKNMMQL